MEYLENNVFAKILRKELPATVVYEDDLTLAFLDIAPVAPGHTLVIPKKSFVNIFDVDEATLAAVIATVRKVAPAVRSAVDAQGVHINSNHGEEAGQVVPHLHFHIIPRHNRGEFEFWAHKKYESSETELELAEKIKEHLLNVR